MKNKYIVIRDERAYDGEPGFSIYDVDRGYRVGFPREPAHDMIFPNKRDAEAIARILNRAWKG